MSIQIFPCTRPDGESRATDPSVARVSRCGRHNHIPSNAHGDYGDEGRMDTPAWIHAGIFRNTVGGRFSEDDQIG